MEKGDRQSTDDHQRRPSWFPRALHTQQLIPASDSESPGERMWLRDCRLLSKKPLCVTGLEATLWPLNVFHLTRSPVHLNPIQIPKNTTPDVPTCSISEPSQTQQIPSEASLTLPPKSSRNLETYPKPTILHLFQHTTLIWASLISYPWNLRALGTGLPSFSPRSPALHPLARVIH
jgi:hypothetical protein